MKGICPQCGAPHKEDDERCAYCGYYFPKKKTEDNNNGNTYGQYTGGTDNHKGLWIAMAVGVLFLGLVGIAISSSSGRSSVGSRPVSNMPPVRGYQTTEAGEETKSKDGVKSGGGRLTSAYYRQFAELVFKKPADEITGEELSQIKVIQAVRDGIYYSFSDPDEEGYDGTVQSMALESRDQNERDLLQFQGLVKLEVEQLTRPGDLSRLPELRSLTVRYFGTDGSSLEEYGSLTGLEELSVRGSGLTGLEGIEKMTSLKRLTLDHTAIQTLSLVSSLNQIEYLGLIENGYLMTMDTLANMAGLKGLEIEGDHIENLSYLKNCKNLETLTIRDTSIKSITFLSDLVNLKELTLDSNNQVKDGSPVSGCTGLVRLSVDETSMEVFPDLSGCKSLQSLELVGAESLADLAGAVNLEELTIQYGVGARDMSGLASLSKLRRLVIDQCNSLEDLKPLSSLTGLKELVINESNVYFDATNIYTIQSLESLSLADCTIGGDIRRIADLPNLRELSLTRVSPVTNIHVETDGFAYSYWWDDIDLNTAIQSFGKLTNLIALSLESNELTNVDFAASLTNLEYLDVSDNYIANMDFVGELKNLKYLNIYSNPLEDYTAVDQLANVIVVGR